MAKEESPQRAYRAACPGCGAPVLFRSAQSTHAVCGYCSSTVVRDGDTLARIGKMADVFKDYSTLQLMASGRWNNTGFTLVGRLQFRYDGGTWNEWEAALDDGTSAVLSEDNGAFVFSTLLRTQRDLPAAEHFRVGATTAINGKPYTVASNAQVTLVAAEGELPHLPPLGTPFAMVELRSDGGEVLGIDYGPTLAGQPPEVSLGRAVNLDDLQLKGLRDESARDDKGQQFDCPNCGAPVQVALASSKSITCQSCSSIIDLSQGTGAALRHALQDEPVQLLIPLGTLGQLQGVTWQVVGFQHRMGHEPGDSDEHFGWSEYLLYNQTKGFTFLVDAEDGWSLVKPATGAPTLDAAEQNATYLNHRYALKYSYNAETTYVAGEFYWQVERGQKTFNRDFAKGKSLLSMERAKTEVTWSIGSQIDHNAVAAAFKMTDKAALLQRADAAPVSFKSGLSVGTIVVIFVMLMILSAILTSCDQCDPKVENCSSTSSGYRSSGGSYGGYSGGGGHK